MQSFTSMQSRLKFLCTVATCRQCLNQRLSAPLYRYCTVRQAAQRYSLVKIIKTGFGVPGSGERRPAFHRPLIPAAWTPKAAPATPPAAPPTAKAFEATWTKWRGAAVLAAPAAPPAPAPPTPPSEPALKAGTAEWGRTVRRAVELGSSKTPKPSEGRAGPWCSLRCPEWREALLAALLPPTLAVTALVAVTRQNYQNRVRRPGFRGTEARLPSAPHSSRLDPQSRPGHAPGRPAHRESLRSHLD